jgi:membrane dipeptidase
MSGDEDLKRKARELYESSLVWDNNLSWERGGYGDADQVLEFAKAGVDVVSLSVAFRDIEGIQKVFRSIATIFADLRKYPDKIQFCRSVDEILAARGSGKIAVHMSFQETLPFEENLDLIGLYYELGVRHALLAYNSRNSVGDGCAEDRDSGLSRFGRAVVREMNRVGMIVDGAHSGFRTTMEAMELCEGPFIFSHTNAYGIYPHYRCVRDEQIKACAATNGVIGITGCGAYMGEVHPTSESIFRHVDYVAQITGAKHVGFGLDYVRNPAYFFETGVRPFPDRWPLPPNGRHDTTDFLGPEALPGLVELMLAHGYSDDDIRGILGENFLRVAKEGWK